MRGGLHILSGAFKLRFMASHIVISAQSLAGRLLVVTPFFGFEHQTDRHSEDSVNLFGKDHEFTKLVIDLKGKDPDDAFSSIPYEKVLVPAPPWTQPNISRASISSTTSRNSSANPPSTNSSPTTSKPGSRNPSTPTTSNPPSSPSSPPTPKHQRPSRP